MAKNERISRESTKRHRKHVAAFGTALGTLVVGQAAPAQAAVINLNIIPNTQPYGSLGGHFLVGPTATTFSFAQWNNGLGKTLYALAYLYGFNTVNSSPITTGQSFFSHLGGATIPAGATGTRTFGFLTQAGQVGYLQMDLGGFGPITYLAAAYEDQGTSIDHPGAAVPEPATGAVFALGLLALGARGVRRLRKEREHAGAEVAES